MLNKFICKNFILFNVCIIVCNLSMHFVILKMLNNILPFECHNKETMYNYIMHLD